MTLYDNPEYAHCGYSGVTFMDFRHENLIVYISRGLSRDMRMYSVRVHTEYAFGGADLFDLHTYEGGELYGFLEQCPRMFTQEERLNPQWKEGGPSSYQEVVRAILGAALKLSPDPAAFIGGVVQAAFQQGKKVGQEEIRSGFRKLLELD